MAALDSYSGVVYKVNDSSQVDPGVQVAVYNETTGVKAAQIISDHLGRYSFSGLLNGTYRIRFYGSSHNPDTESFIFTVYDPDQIVIPDAITLPLVTIDSSVKLNVSESGGFLDGNVSFSNPSVASITASNIDILTNADETKGAVASVDISYRPRRTSITGPQDKFYDGADSSAINQWVPLGSKNVQLKDTNQIAKLDLPGIPVSEEETLYYEFRAQFLNGDGVAAKIKNTGATIYTSSAISVAWTGAELVVTGAIASPTNILNHKVQFIQSAVLKFEGVPYKTLGSGSGTTLHFYFPANPLTQFGSADTLVIPDLTFDTIYDVTGSSGHGVDFNGLNDLVEMIEVKQLKGTISNSLYALEWYNYKDITGIFSGGSGTVEDPHTVSLPYADGVSRTTTHLQLNAISIYQVYLFVSSDGKAPTYEYPIGSKNGSLSSTGEDDHGQWYLAKEISAPAIGYAEYPKVELLLPVPAGQQVAVFVGGRTAVTHGDTSAPHNPFTDKGSALDGIPPLDAGDKATTGEPPVIA